MNVAFPLEPRAGIESTVAFPAGTLTVALPLTAPLRLATADTWAGHETPVSVYLT